MKIYPHHKTVAFFYHQSSHHHRDKEHHQKVVNNKKSTSDLVLRNGDAAGDADDNAVEEVVVVDKKTVVVLVVDQHITAVMVGVGMKDGNMAETVAAADSVVVAEEDGLTQEVPPQMKPFLVEEDNNTGTDQMKMMEFPFLEDDALNDIDGDRHQIQQALKQKK